MSPQKRTEEIIYNITNEKRIAELTSLLDAGDFPEHNKIIAVKLTFHITTRYGSSKINTVHIELAPNPEAYVKTMDGNSQNAKNAFTYCQANLLPVNSLPRILLYASNVSKKVVPYNRYDAILLASSERDCIKWNEIRVLHSNGDEVVAKRKEIGGASYWEWEDTKETYPIPDEKSFALTCENNHRHGSCYPSFRMADQSARTEALLMDIPIILYGYKGYESAERFGMVEYKPTADRKSVIITPLNERGAEYLATPFRRIL